MCTATGKPPAFVCTLGALVPGTEFHTPDGETWMVLAPIPCADSFGVGNVLVVNLGNARGGHNRFGRNGDELKGRVTPMYADVALGYDHKGRFYASTALNEWYLYADDLGRTWVPPADQTDTVVYADDNLDPGTN